MIHILSTLRTAPCLCKIASLTVLLVVTVIHIQSLCSHIRVYTHTYSSQFREAGRAKEIKNLGQQLMPCANEIFPRNWFVSPALNKPNLPAARIYRRVYAVPVGLVHTKGYSVLQMTPVAMCRMKGSLSEPTENSRWYENCDSGSFLINQSCFFIAAWAKIKPSYILHSCDNAIFMPCPVSNLGLMYTQWNKLGTAL
jgi:hypothetical protein